MDIKETKEALIGLNELALVIAVRLKDGFQVVEDISAVVAKLMSDAEFQAKLQAAYENIGAIPEEIKDLQLNEVIELVGVQVGYVPKFVEALKK
ncbi:MAG TPA: hypothetical protein P5523_04790 [Bacteroidales bacterium]|nr:hypothetical protein [Bacteroidales bacterium]